MKLLVTLLCCLIAAVAKPQLLTWTTSQFPNDNSSIVITVDATKGNLGLMGFAGSVYMHLGVITNLSTSATDWRYVPTTWASTTAPTAINVGTNKWLFQITNPRTYFNVPVNETILKVALLFRNADGSKVQKNADGSDMYVPIYPAGANAIQFTVPLIIPTSTISNEPVSATVGQAVPVTAVASTTSGTLNIYFNGAKVTGPLAGTNTISANAVVANAGAQTYIAELIVGGVSYYDTLQFYIPPPNVIEALPNGVKEGINYGANCSSATLVLYAPYKTNAVVIGDFAGSNWYPQTQYQMKKTPDGNYYWLTISGLTPGTEYAFQYVVDNSIYIADAFTEKVLDPWNDKYISTATYPNLKPYPTNPNVLVGRNGIVGVLQTCQPAYNWKVTNFIKPDKRNLMTYEMRVGDFGAVQGAGNFQLLIDSINYFKRLGVNAIELMPVQEFGGNDSWGYNAVFYGALDKSYGTKAKYKEFIDLCHQNGIAVIMDVVYNQMDAFNAPQGRLYWDAAKSRPAANNPWLNIVPPHPYIPYFNDLNHESPATQYLVEHSLEYWLSEYKIDGFRLDLAKGFTQKCTQVNELCPSAIGNIEDYDASRVANLERYYDYLVSRFPNTYMILEFLGHAQEESVYGNYGFLLWGEIYDQYKQAILGVASNSNFSKIVYNSAEAGFSIPAQMGFMQSHDKQRMMYESQHNGNSSGGYDVKTIANGLQRQAAAVALMFTVPGPKMFFEFDERGQDLSINTCPNGSLPADDQCKTGYKPSHWEYMLDPDRLKLFDAYSKLISLRLSNPAVFSNTTFSYDFYDGGGLYRRFQIADPNANGMKVTVVANFDVVAQSRSVTFQSTGNWYNYLSNGTGAGINGTTGTVFNIASAAQNILLKPGEYHVYVSHPSNTYTFIGKGNWNVASNWTYNTIPPTPLPSGSIINIAPQSGGECILNVAQTIANGATLNIKPGRYFKTPSIQKP